MRTLHSRRDWMAVWKARTVAADCMVAKAVKLISEGFIESNRKVRMLDFALDGLNVLSLLGGGFGYVVLDVLLKASQAFACVVQWRLTEGTDGVPPGIGKGFRWARALSRELVRRRKVTSRFALPFRAADSPRDRKQSAATFSAWWAATRASSSVFSLVTAASLTHAIAASILATKALTRSAERRSCLAFAVGSSLGRGRMKSSASRRVSWSERVPSVLILDGSVLSLTSWQRGDRHSCLRVGGRRAGD